MEKITDPNEWEYRAEGNLHVIVANKKTKQVLRLLKCSKDTIYNEVASLEATGNELSYVRYVAHPLMQNCKACFPMHQVLLGQEFLNAISKKVKDARPSFRRHKSVDTSRKYGILMPDFCQVLPPPPPSELDVCISVEIKPKQGFILTGQKQCKFSQCQRLKVQSKTYDRESGYCPVDLFSGSKKRMQRAIKSLISEPQNNLRIFKNGCVIYSQEVVEERKDRAKDVFKSTVLPIFASHFRQQSNNDRLKQAYHSFKDLLCNLLLHPVCEQSPVATHTPQLCDNSSDIPPKRNSVENESKFPNTGSKYSSEARLSSNCTLGLLLSLQKLENRSVAEYYKMYSLLQNHLDSFPDDASLLSLEGPYDAPHWQEIVDEMWQNGSKDYMRENEESWKKDVMKTACLLRKFLIATSFKDCSLIMAYQLKNRDENSTQCELPMTIKTRHGQEYWGSLALVDSDPKPASRIPEYYNLACSLQCDP